MNSIRAQNAIIDLLRGVVNDVQVTDLKVHSTADPTLEDSDSEELKGPLLTIQPIYVDDKNLSVVHNTLK